jgi:gamma-glutamyltranspeptidase/glutathione hydrolase
MMGIGGEMFAIIHFDGEYDALNGSARAGDAATLAEYRRRTDTEEDVSSVHPWVSGAV